MDRILGKTPTVTIAIYVYVVPNKIRIGGYFIKNSLKNYLN